MLNFNCQQLTGLSEAVHILLIAKVAMKKLLTEMPAGSIRIGIQNMRTDIQIDSLLNQHATELATAQDSESEMFTGE